MLGAPLAQLQETIFAGQGVDGVEHEGHVVEVEVDAPVRHFALLADAEELVGEHVDIGHQHHVDVGLGPLLRLGLGILLGLGGGRRGQAARDMGRQDIPGAVAELVGTVGVELRPNMECAIICEARSVPLFVPVRTSGSKSRPSQLARVPLVDVPRRREERGAAGRK